MQVESLLESVEVLYFVKQEGCPACEAAAPELARFMAAHPRVTVITIDANGPFPERLGLKLKATPTYFFKRGNEGAAVAGAMKMKDLERWVKKIGGTL